MMREFVLVGSSSPYRQAHYEQHLLSHGFDVCVVPGGVDCLRELSIRTPSVLLLECSLLWGGAEGVLDVKSEESDWKDVPVVLLANDGVTTDAYRLARFPIYGFFSRFPSDNDLICAIRGALQAADHGMIRNTVPEEATHF
jgi:DNA-binding NtrC family response regulator